MQAHTLIAAAALAAPALPSLAQATAPAQQPAAAEQVIVPQVERLPVKPPRYPSNDFAIGLFGGTYATQNFGASSIGGVRLSYHVT
jgi:hypothetical protein